MKKMIPVDSVVRGLYACVYLQDSLVIHVGLTVALQGFVSHGPAQERLEGERLQLQGSDWHEHTGVQGGFRYLKKNHIVFKDIYMGGSLKIS